MPEQQSNIHCRQRILQHGAAVHNVRAVLRTALLSLLVWHVGAWGNSDSDTSDSSVYGNALTRDWLYDGSAVSMKLMGCVWGFVKDAEDSGCLERSSEDGTQYWYMMANCRRAQAVFGLYSGTSCSSSNFKESFITKEGVSEFIYYLSEYDNNNAFEYYVGNDDANEDDADPSYDNLPICEQYNGKYIGVGCTDDGYFALEYFNDAYCTDPTGNVYDSLKTLNRALKNYRSCATVQKSGNNNNEGGGLPSMLLKTSDSCSSLDSDLCTDNNYMKARRTHTTKSNRISTSVGLSAKTWLTKLKYVVAGMLLLASFVMFTGILFTNRRRRRALMQRKYKQSSKKRSSSKRDDRSSRSKSKTRDKSDTRTKSSSSRRSKSRHREDKEDAGGVLA